VQLNEPATSEEVNSALKQAAEGDLRGILRYSEEPLVSIDFNGSTLSSIIDAPSTMAIGDMVKVLSWYDNEFGYSNRMVELAVYMANS
jgi:glyceraldehyde 3-phosphate dehydrogenase